MAKKSPNIAHGTWHLAFFVPRSVFLVGEAVLVPRTWYLVGYQASVVSLQRNGFLMAEVCCLKATIAQGRGEPLCSHEAPTRGGSLCVSVPRSYTCRNAQLRGWELAAGGWMQTPSE